jgi:hypothetical protein
LSFAIRYINQEVSKMKKSRRVLVPVAALLAMGASGLAVAQILAAPELSGTWSASWQYPLVGGEGTWTISQSPHEYACPPNTGLPCYFDWSNLPGGVLQDLEVSSSTGDSWTGYVAGGNVLSPGVVVYLVGGAVSPGLPANNCVWIGTPMDRDLDGIDDFQSGAAYCEGAVGTWSATR